MESSKLFFFSLSECVFVYYFILGVTNKFVLSRFWLCILISVSLGIYKGKGFHNIHVTFLFCLFYKVLILNRVSSYM